MSWLYPLTFKPVYQPYIWGGDKIIREYNRDEPPGVYAESWEISDRSEGMSVVLNGPLAGKSLAEVIGDAGTDLLGTDVQTPGMPLLFKLIDSKKDLSIQVHPDDDTAAQYGGESKTEMWYILHADPDACVYSGFKPGTTEEVYRKAIEDNTVEDYAVRVPVETGDVIFTPGGRVHAIGSGCLLLEVQQNSNTTYRIYDWGRVGADGNPRELHIDQAMQVIAWDDHAPAKAIPRRLGHLGENELWEMLKCPFFRMEKLYVNEPWPSAMDGRSFHALFIEEGTVAIAWGNDSLVLPRGTSCLVPAGLGEYELSSGDQAKVIRVTVP